MNGVTWIHLPRRAGMGLIRLYQRAVSPLLAPRCRFYPSCSHYAHQALAEHGFVKGLALTVWRLLRCHPLHPGGYDPVTPAAPGRAGRK